MAFLLSWCRKAPPPPSPPPSPSAQREPRLEELGLPSAIGDSQHATERMSALPFSMTHAEGNALRVTVKKSRRGRGKAVELEHLSEEQLRQRIPPKTPLMTLATNEELFWNLAHTCSNSVNTMEKWLFM